ncbi:hypothetical protein BAUCODRAFT_434731 [Baudoinia panamericana UAMH 10762]|uniref:DUF676 domain-containing protein n=1 Tax=Baudoinia panamericana (strain UAMH 10762) TaxID=717646 RepID=M2MJV8_BAUPA|nr:uncharacterized protein BAUCODRAFT_434731 [Baudoinia panamericana UAMH 10762]EMC96971.1 hypothetical protein BAUCODRAFT_434731 [Baudoinia panamericana UAMH 10762]
MSNYGTTVLCEGETPIAVDVVFVHELGGDGRDSWSRDGLMWPEELFGERIPNARIITWGYDSSPKDFFQGNGQQTLKGRALELLSDLKDERRQEEKNRSIIFIGHSLGGLTIKQALTKAHGIPNKA